MELKRIGVFSAAKVLGVMYAVIGLLIGLIFACFGLVTLTGLTADVSSDVAGFMGGFGILNVVIGICGFPIFYGIMGVIAGTVGALVYNVVAGWLGGLELEFSQK